MEILFAWSDSLSVGIQEIDEQHKVLVGLLNELQTAIVEHHGSAACRSILDRLAEYTRVHFAVEESLMRIFGYPDYEPHKHEHEMLVQQIVGLQEKLDAGKAAISFELLHFLKVWLTDHIRKSDRQYGPYFLSRGIEPVWEKNGDGGRKKHSWKFWEH